MREIIVDRGNGAKAFVLFELTKGNIAEIKDRYILEQLRSAIDSPWSTALPDGIRSALIRSVSEEMEDRFLLENMDKDTDMSVKSAIRSAAIKAITENMNSSSFRVASIRTRNAIAISRSSTSHLSRASRRFPFPTSRRMTISKSGSLPTT